MTYKSAVRKFKIETLLISPFVLLGKLWGKIKPLKTESRFFFFFPNGDIGGSPRVNIDITKLMAAENPVIIFSKKPKNNQFLERFQSIPGVTIIDLSSKIDNKLFHYINLLYRGVIASWINKQKNPVILGGECLFFYKMLPHVKKTTKCVEICHLPTWLFYSIGWIDKIDLRVFSTQKLMEEVEAQYMENNLGQKYYDRLTFSDNAIDIPTLEEVNNPQLEVVFIGRGHPQKRVYLIAQIAEAMHQQNRPIHFSFVGDVSNVIETEKYPFCKFYGNVSDEKLMNKIYATSDVLLMTSAYEGLPVVVMMMMAYAKVVVSTAVNGIPDYIHNDKNGLLIYSKEEKDIVDEGVEKLNYLIEHPEIRKEMGLKSRQQAIAKFSYESFGKAYRHYLLGE